MTFLFYGYELYCEAKSRKPHYICEAINHWDKEPRQERKYLGRIEIETNSFVKTKMIRGRETTYLHQHSYEKSRDFEIILSVFTASFQD
ncbi:MAG: hypothetical protein ACP5H0_06905 [Caldisericum sp.]|uniref:hypothetical protein n=1 Tax=Caldisericum sp. TaxID=2499687 RepID=UPI003D0E4A5F